LSKSAADTHQEISLILFFNALTNDLDAQSMSHLDNQTNNFTSLFGVIRLYQKIPVNFNEEPDSA
jgi:hypothetical protein